MTDSLLMILANLWRQSRRHCREQAVMPVASIVRSLYSTALTQSPRNHAHNQPATS